MIWLNAIQCTRQSTHNTPRVTHVDCTNMHYSCTWFNSRLIVLLRSQSAFIECHWHTKNRLLYKIPHGIFIVIELWNTCTSVFLSFFLTFSVSFCLFLSFSVLFRLFRVFFRFSSLFSYFFPFFFINSRFAVFKCSGFANLWEKLHKNLNKEKLCVTKNIVHHLRYMIVFVVRRHHVCGVKFRLRHHIRYQ